MDVMVDIETLSTSADAIVIQLAAARFDDERIHDSFTTPLDPRGQLQKGREWDWNTVLWWVRQDNCFQVWNEALHADLGVRESLQKFSEWYHDVPVVSVWAKPPTFDLSILESLYRQYSIAVPWDHRAPRDVRTLMGLVPDSCHVRRGTHIALEDVKDQCLSVINAKQYLKGAQQ